MAAIELDLREYLKKYSGMEVDFYRFPGNYGDSLIWHGTMRLLESLGITVRYVEIESPVSNDVLFIDGGGNFVDYYSDVRDFLIKKPSQYAEIVILPHTIMGERQVEVLNAVSSNLTVFCRERVSAEFLSGRLERARVYLWNDCAFYNEFPHIPGGEGTLNAFRVDTESVRESKPEENVDLSYDGYAMKPIGELIDAIKPYTRIRTDRLHIGILSTLLGKQVEFYPNSYYKNKAVFDYSLSKFLNITFIESHNREMP